MKPLSVQMGQKRIPTPCIFTLQFLNMKKKSEKETKIYRNMWNFLDWKKVFWIKRLKWLKISSSFFCEICMNKFYCYHQWICSNMHYLSLVRELREIWEGKKEMKIYYPYHYIYFRVDRWIFLILVNVSETNFRFFRKI